MTANSLIKRLLGEAAEEEAAAELSAPVETDYAPKQDQPAGAPAEAPPPATQELAQMWQSGERMSVAARLMFTQASYADFVDLLFILGHADGRELGRLLDELADTQGIEPPETPPQVQRPLAARSRGGQRRRRAMNNPLMRRLLGESDVVPVIANVPRETFRNRMVKKRQIEVNDSADDSVRRLVGEADEDSGDETREEGVIPDDAEAVDAAEMTVGKPLRQPKEIVQEPSHPADKEKYQTPYAALTAPDVTPQATEPIDPSQVPGTARPERFRAADLERAVPVDSGASDTAARAMDVLLGHNRTSKPATQPGEFEQAGAISTEEAARLVGAQPIAEESKAKAALLLVAAKDGGSGMPPPPAQGDGSAIYSTFRRFSG